MAFETLTDLIFYSPWPKYGTKLVHQWPNLRHNHEVLHGLATNAIFEADPNDLKNGILAGFDFGEENFSNKFRLIWQANDDSFLFQCNKGTQASPLWDTAFYIDCPEDEIIFLKNVIFTANSPFQVTFKETETGGGSFSADAIKVDSSFFYLSAGGDGDPILSLHSSPGGSGGISSVTFKETETDGASFSGAVLNIDSDFFYLSSNGSGEPILSSNRNQIDEKSITVILPDRNSEYSWWVPSKNITVKKAFASLSASDSGFYPSIRWSVRYASSRFDAGTELINDGTWTDFYPNAAEHSITTFDNPNISFEDKVWLEVKDLGEGGGAEEEFHLTLHYNYDD